MRFKTILVVSSIIFTLSACEKELPTYEAPKEKYRKQINNFLKSFFQTNPVVRSKEPAAGLWVADQKSLKAFIGKRFMAQSEEEGLSKKVIENRLKKIRMFLRVSAGQLLLVNFSHTGDLSPPQEGRFSLKKKAGNLRHYKGSLRPKTDKNGKTLKPHPFKLKLKSTGVSQELVFEDSGNQVLFKRENMMPVALYDTYHQRAEKMKEAIEF